MNQKWGIENSINNFFQDLEKSRSLQLALEALEKNSTVNKSIRSSHVKYSVII